MNRSGRDDVIAWLIEDCSTSGATMRTSPKRCSGFCQGHDAWAVDANLGLNLGNSCWHSGTLAAAKQAALLGSRGIAFSTNVSDNREPDFSALEPYVARVLDLLMSNKTLSLVNVNLPEKPKGIRWTRQSVRHYDGKVVPDKDPMGRSIFWFTVTPLQSAAEGTDRWAVEHNWVSITPLRLDLTDEADLARALPVSNTPTIKPPRKQTSRTRLGRKQKKR